MRNIRTFPMLCQPIHAAGQRLDLPIHLQLEENWSQLTDGDVHRQGNLIDMRFALLTSPLETAPVLSLFREEQLRLLR